MVSAADIAGVMALVATQKELNNWIKNRLPECR
jgi:hypothetical protein